MSLRNRTVLHPYRVLFWTLFALGALTMFLNRHPIELDAEDAMVAGRPAPRTARGDVVVVLSPEETLAATRRGEFERSWAWVDLIRQEIGPVTTIDADAFDADAIAEHGVVIVTQSASASPVVQERGDIVEAFARSGGTIVLELPQGELRRRFAADGGGGWRDPSGLTAVDGVDEAVARRIRRMPLLTRFRGSTRPLAEASTIVALDGAPVVYARDVGAGSIVVIDMDVGAQLSAMQQGLPSPSGTVQSRASGERVRTFDLVATPALVGADTPYADLFERYIAHVVLARRAPIFALWPYPELTHGALVTSHDATLLSGRPLWMSIHERDSGARSATFVAPPRWEPDEPIAIADAEFVGHAALLWEIDASESALDQRLGIPGVRPLSRPLTLAGQRERLEAALGDRADVRGVRTIDGRWSRSFTEPFRIMDAAELRYSVSYGPGPTAPPGFLFGTCQPFTPLDVNGLPFDVLEVPVCFDNPESPSQRDALFAALDRAATSKWAVHLLTSADRFRDAPSMDGFDIWRDALRFAERNRMWIGGAGELVSFWNRRSTADLRVIDTEVTRRDRDGTATAMRFVVEAETASRGMALMVPDSWSTLAFDYASRASAEAPLTVMADRLETRTTTHLERDVHLIALNPGFTTVIIRYERAD